MSRPLAIFPRVPLWGLGPLLIVAAIQVLPSPTLGQSKMVGPKAANGAAMRMLERWDRALRTADDALTAGTPKKAIKQTNRVLNDCLRTALSGEPVERRLAMAFVLRAIAAHQLGEPLDARWDWQAALLLFPAASEWDLAAYGVDGEAIALIISKPPLDLKNALWVDQAPTGLVKPKKLNAPLPNFRFQAPTRTGTLSIRFHTGVNGRLHSPNVDTSSVPATLLAAALNSFGDWRFEPGRFDGEPTSMFLLQNLTIRW